MSPRLSRIGAHGAGTSGRGRYWVAAANFTEGQSSVDSVSVVDGTIVVGGTMYGPADSYAEGDGSWLLLSRSGGLVADRVLDSADESYGKAAATDGESAYLVFLQYVTGGTRELLYKVNTSGDIVWKAGDTDDYRAIADALAASPGYLYGLAGNWLVRYSTSDGSLVWKAEVYPQSIGCDASGNVYFVSGAAGTSKSVVKVDASGAFVWGKTITAGATGLTCGVFVRGSYVYVRGDVDEAWSFVSKFDLSGTHQWTTTLEDGGFSLYSTSLDVDADGNVYLNGPIKLNASGALQWSRTVDAWADCAIDADGSALVLASGVAGSLSLPPFEFTVVARLPLDGSGTGAYTLALLDDEVTWTYSAASVSTTADSVSVASYTASLTLNYDTSPYTPPATTDAGMVRGIVTV